jgi:NADH-quinone oxidoreductase subunit L
MLELWLLFLPILSAVICGLFLLNYNKKYSAGFASIIMTITAGLAWVIFTNLFFRNIDPYTVKICDFIKFADFSTSWEIKIDRLSALMLIVVTTVSAVVHAYSIGYMGDDKSLPRFMAYISLFTFFMLILVVSSNLLQLFVGWEGVGLSSYLLIGFWYNKKSANLAAKKAFIVNRVGDLFLLVGIIAVYYCFGTFEFTEIISKIAEIPPASHITIFTLQIPILEFIGILLFLGAMGKSAQIGLHVWLPDAMEGPTPVSALIHAATMVTAGIFLIARFSPLYDQTILARELITYIGAITAIFASTVAIVQTDIKKIIAYSTCSQLGYMFFACGVGAYNAGMFHLMTHAFFKALLFLSAGSVIHGLSGEQNIFKMGNLRKKMPVSFIYFLIGTIAISGFYPFAGFYSKDAILESAYASQTFVGNFAYLTGVLVAFLTSLYSWRLMIVVFGGKRNYLESTIPHESPKIMLVPVFLLVIGSIFSGGLAYKMGVVDSHANFWLESISVKIINTQYLDMHALPFIIKYLPLIASSLGLICAWFIYIVLDREYLKNIKNKFNKLYNFLFNKWYVDELYEVIFVNNLKKLASITNRFFEIKIIDGCGPMGAASLVNLMGARLKVAHSGYIYHYALCIFASAVLILSWFIWSKLY